MHDIDRSVVERLYSYMLISQFTVLFHVTKLIEISLDNRSLGRGIFSCLTRLHCSKNPRFFEHEI